MTVFCKIFIICPVTVKLERVTELFADSSGFSTKVIAGITVEESAMTKRLLYTLKTYNKCLQ